MQLSGIHHVTAVTAKASQNLHFYTQILGLRLVKKTVNQDDVRAYHLFYADGADSPGSDLTFFDWSLAAREIRGNNSISRTALRVRESSLEWWAAHLTEKGVQHGGVLEQGGYFTPEFDDFENQRLALVGDPNPAPAHPWPRSPVPLEHQILGLGPVTLTLPRLTPTDKLLSKVYGMRAARHYPDPESVAHTVHVFKMGLGGPSAEVHIRVRPDLPMARAGAGGVHHLAFRIPDADYHAWSARLEGFGLRTSGEVDRFYFRSLYYREPNGILIELATDGPGFASDEDAATMGESLSLPPFLEGRRTEIESKLKTLELFANLPDSSG